MAEMDTGATEEHFAAVSKEVDKTGYVVDGRLYHEKVVAGGRVALGLF